MRILGLALLLLGSLGQLSVAQDLEGGPWQGYVFSHVNVLPMEDETMLENQHVYIRDGLIERIVPAGDPSGVADAYPSDAADANTDPLTEEGYRVIEAQGRYLLPGLAEMHAHIPGAGQREFAEHVLFMYLAHGVTTIRGMLGEPWHLELREAVAKGDLPGPRIYTSGPSFNGTTVESPAQGARRVAEQAEAGYDFLKIHPGLERDEFDAIVAAAREHEIEFAGHVPSTVGVPRALAVRQASIDHLDGYMETLVARMPTDQPAGFFGFNLVERADPQRIAAIASATRQAGVWIVPTETIMINALSPESPEALAARPEMAYLPASLVERWVVAKHNFLAQPGYSAARAERFLALRTALLAAMHEHGVELLLGSDSPQFFNVPGHSIVPELEAMRAAGLSHYEVLRTGTVNPARFFNAEQTFGRINEGLEADLVLLEANPLESFATLRSPQGVMFRGQWLDRAALEAGLAGIREAAAELP
jgi:imidazolonepropionase-like amidohydrolase